MKNKLHILTLLIVCYSCNNKKNDSFNVIKYYKNGNVCEVISYKGDSVLHGPHTMYYENGNLKVKTDYKNGVITGNITNYYLDGNMKSIESYYKNRLNGYYTDYYTDGIIKSRCYFLWNQQFGDSYFYYPNGKLSAYSSFDFDENARYFIKYDSIGNKIMEKGTALGQFHLEGNFDSILVNKQYESMISVNTPPNTKTEVFNGELVNNKLQNISKLSVLFNCAQYKFTFSDTGKHTFLTIGEIRDLQGKLLIKDSIESIFIVRNE
jgi:antitoxin component YwqK of YwqJK toxin-antitoxin module